MMRVAPPWTAPTSGMRPESPATPAERPATPVPSTSVPPLMIRSCTEQSCHASLRSAHRMLACTASDLGFAQNPVHFRAADRAGALCGTGPVGQLDFLAVELTLLSALHAVPLVVSHGNSFGRGWPWTGVERSGGVLGIGGWSGPCRHDPELGSHSWPTTVQV